jgi:hypothetical protein
MADDMSVLVDDVSDITAAVNAIVVTRAKIQGHKPNLFFILYQKELSIWLRSGTSRNILREI